MESVIIKEFMKNIHQLIPNSAMQFKIEPQPFSGDLWKPDSIASVSYKGNHFKLALEVASHISLSLFKGKLAQIKSYSGQKKNIVPVIVSQYLSPERRQLCKNHGVYFIDLSGNLYLEYGDLYIERVGFPNKFPEQRKGRGPFSDKASLILRALISNGEKLWKIREIADVLKLDPGFVSRLMKELEKRNYVARSNKKIKLHDPQKIIDDWVYVYDYKKNQEFKYFYLAESPEAIIQKVKKVNIAKEMIYVLGYQAGANLVSPFSIYKEVHIYVKEKKDIEFWVQELELKKVEHGANLIFLLPYYKNSVFYDKQWVDNLWVTSDLQLYLDLYHFPIRGREQAEHLFEKRLRRYFKD